MSLKQWSKIISSSSHQTTIITSFKEYLVLIICICLCLCVSEHKYPQRAQALDPLELELQVVVNHLMRVLGPKLLSSARAVRAFNQGAISLACGFFFELHPCGGSCRNILSFRPGFFSLILCPIHWRPSRTQADHSVWVVGYSHIVIGFLELHAVQ